VKILQNSNKLGFIVQLRSGGGAALGSLLEGAGKIADTGNFD
jgi:hypothetical protein